MTTVVYLITVWQLHSRRDVGRSTVDGLLKPVGGPTGKLPLARAREGARAHSFKGGPEAKSQIPRRKSGSKLDALSGSLAPRISVFVRFNVRDGILEGSLLSRTFQWWRVEVEKRFCQSIDGAESVGADQSLPKRGILSFRAIWLGGKRSRSRRKGGVCPTLGILPLSNYPSSHACIEENSYDG